MHPRIIVLALFSAFCKGQEWRYVTLENTKHNGTMHKTMSTGALDPLAVRHACSSLCSMVDSCDGFYVENKDLVDGDCHLVDEDAEAGQAQRITEADLGKVFYAKAPMDAQSAAISPGAFGIRPCDTDTSELPSTICSSDYYFPKQLMTVKSCASIDTTAISQTVTLIQDMKCPGEDRIAACEVLALEGSNFESKMKNELLMRSSHTLNSYRSSQDQLGSLKFTLRGAPVKLSRMIIRSTTSNQGTKLMRATVVIVSKDMEQEVPINLDNDDCVVMITFPFLGPVNGITLWDRADKLEIRDMEWSGPSKASLKIDLFTSST